jgi:hypothetical protein
MAKHSFSTLMRRLSRAGFKKDFVTTALLPDWWEESCALDPNLLPEIEIRVARFLDAPLADIRNANSVLALPSKGMVQLRKVRDTNRDRLGPAIHSAVRISQAVVRNLRISSTIETIPRDALEWRDYLQSSRGLTLGLEGIVDDLWQRGIPVIPLEILPAPSFQGLACIVDDHPVIVLGNKYDEPGRVAFFVAHEAGHIAAGDCSTDTFVLDENEDVSDESEVERDADQFASLFLVGDEDVAIAEDTTADAKTIAQQAFNLENETGADASCLIFSWAARTLDYATATMAVKALYRSNGARTVVRNKFDEYVDVEDAGESDLDLLRCVYGRTSPSAIAG